MTESEINFPNTNTHLITWSIRGVFYHQTAKTAAEASALLDKIRHTDFAQNVKRWELSEDWTGEFGATE